MRGLVADLATPHSIRDALPALYREDEFAERFVGAMDELFAPVFTSIDCFTAYLDPGLAPDDFLEWLAGWVGVSLDQTWPLERRRRMVASAVELYRRRGTVAGLAAQLEIFTGGVVTITESGGVAWSATPGSALPGDSTPCLIVRVAVPDPRSIAMARLEALVSSAKPAHMPHQIQVVESGE